MISFRPADYDSLEPAPPADFFPQTRDFSEGGDMNGDAYEVRIYAQAGKARTTNVMHYLETSPCNDPFPASRLINALHPLLWSHFRNWVGGDVVIDYFYARRVHPSPSHPGEAVTDYRSTISLVANCIVPNSTVVFKLQSNPFFSVRHAKFCCSWIFEGANQNGVVAPLSLNGIKTDVIPFFTAAVNNVAGGGGSWVPCIFRDQEDFPTPISRATVRSVLGTMQTRRVKPIR